MTGMIQNREVFLDQIADSLGRNRRSSGVKPPSWKYRPQDQVLKELTSDELLEVLRKQCHSIHTNLVVTDIANLPTALNDTVISYGGGPIITWKDERFTKWGLDPLFNNEWPKKKMDVYEWNYERGKENVDQAERANVGITISEITLAESGTVVLFSDKDKGRSVSFLPATYIALIPKSSLVPRITQAARKMRDLHLSGKKVPSCINFITGPSNSADIELNLVVGVHGPVKATYIVIEDL